MPNYNFFTYILTNLSKTVLYTGVTKLYTGVTNDLDRRLYKHYFNDVSNSFTNKYKCYYLVWFERHQYIEHAIEREKEIKGWSREKNANLIQEENPDWNFLN